MKSIKYILVGLIAVLVAGCVQQRIIWSPDGMRALVLGKDGLYVCDVAGKISPLLVPGAKTAQWLPDGKRAIVAIAGDKPKENDYRVSIYAIDDSSATPQATIFPQRLPHGKVEQMRVSPTGAAVALILDHDSDPGELIIAATDDSQITSDMGPAADYPDWTPDGRDIVFIRPYNYVRNSKDNPVMLGMLTRRRVVDDKGALLTQVPTTKPLSPTDDLAGMFFDNSSRIRVAKDGRIFFSAMETTLPTTIPDFPGQTMIFCLDPGKLSTLSRVIPRGAAQDVGDAAQYFEFSPDMQYLSIPFSDGRVSILNVATGDSQIVQPAGEPDNGGNQRLAVLPAWRTPDELTFVRPTGDGVHHEVVNYSISKKTATVINSDWPTSVMNLVNKPATQPATEPSSK